MSAKPFAIDFHVHTAYSFDSLTPPRLAIEIARMRGLHGIAITDHDTVEGGLAALRCNPYEDFLVIPGIEVKSDIGDVIGLFVKSAIRATRFSDVTDEIHAQGGVVYLPHPLRTLTFEELRGVLDGSQVDLWELYNGRYGAREFEEARKLQGRVGGTRVLCGSDAHLPWEVGMFRTLVPELPRDPAALLAIGERVSLEAAPRGDLARRSGIVFGEATRTFKSGEYAKGGRLLASLPLKALRRAMRSAPSR